MTYLTDNLNHLCPNEHWLSPEEQLWESYKFLDRSNTRIEVPIVKIRGIEGLSVDHLSFEVDRGARFVRYRYCWSSIVLTCKEPSDIYFIRAGESRLKRGLPYVLLTLLLGWWGFPFGPIYSIQALLTDFQGGEDVTDLVLYELRTARAGPVSPCS